MNMSIIRKEFLELLRDGRAIGLSLIVSLLLMLALITGLSTESAREQTFAKLIL